MSHCCRPSVTQSLGAVEIGSAAALKMGGSVPSSVHQPAICAAPSSVPASPSATVLQLLLRYALPSDLFWCPLNSYLLIFLLYEVTISTLN